MLEVQMRRGMKELARDLFAPLEMKYDEKKGISWIDFDITHRRERF
jgi:hypothetical protein